MRKEFRMLESSVIFGDNMTGIVNIANISFSQF